MNYRIIRAVGLAAAVGFSAAVCRADDVKGGIAAELAFIKRVFNVAYAPTEWKSGI
ncbi:MAG: hypothetical protein HC902_11965 [Calothrix sp. SM1_5_4]|nr:hypothetical protein [Calothrix sp. SM1_5_4]